MHTILYRGCAKIRDQQLKYADMADDQSGYDLLFQIHNDRLQTLNQISVRLSARESGRES